MNQPIGLTPQDLINIIIAVCAAIITVSSAIAVILNFIKKTKEPEAAQNNRITALEDRMNEVDQKLANDKKRLDNIEYGHEVTQEALLALLNYQLNPEDKDPLREAKKTLETYLVKRRNT